MTAPQAAREYRRVLAWVRAQPEGEQWQHGARLRELQARYKVESEAAQVRRS